MENELTYDSLLHLFRLSDERFEKRLEQQRQQFEAERQIREQAQEQVRAQERRARIKEREARAQKRQAQAQRLEEERQAQAQRLEEERQAQAQRLEEERQAQAKEREAQAKRNEEYLQNRIKEREEFAKENKAFVKEQKQAQKELNKKLAEITDTLGRFAEHQVRPAALRLFKKLKIPIYQDGFNLQKFGQDGEYLYEVDILLFNTDFIVAIEVKSTLRMDDINEHIERMELMQQYPLKGTRGTAIIGAIAAMNASSDIVRYAIKKGLYVIVPNGASVRVANQAGFQPRHWAIE